MGNKTIYFANVLLMLFAILIFCQNAKSGDKPDDSYVYKEDTSRIVGWLKADIVYLGRLDSKGVFIYDEKLGSLRHHQPYSGWAYELVNIPCNKKSEKVYEYQDGKLVPGELGKDGVFTPNIKEKTINFDEYKYTPDAHRIYNLPGQFVKCGAAHAEEEKKGPKYEGKTLSEWVEQLSSDYEEKRIAAIQMLGKIGNKSAVLALITTSGDHDNSIQQAVIAALESIGKPAVPELIKALEDKNCRVRQSAAIVLGGIKDKSAIPALVNIIKNKEFDDGNKYEDYNVRAAAATALGRIGSKSSTRLLLSLLKDKYWRVRRGAMYGLGFLKAKSAIRPLVKILLEDESKWHRLYAADALGYIGDKSAIPALIKSLGNDWGYLSISDEQNRVVTALIKIGKPAIPALIKTLQGTNELASERAAKILKDITTQDFGEDSAKWQEWWDANKDRILKEAAEKEKAGKD